jgi:hypothetical protein
MNASSDNTARKGLRGWWANPPRSGIWRFIAPWEYRHLRGWGSVRIVSGLVALGLGAIVVSQVRDAWLIFGAYLLLAGAGNIAFGCWELNFASTEPAQA